MFLVLHQKLSKDELRKKTEEMLEVVGIRKERINDYPHQWSGGMRQRAATAMTLSLAPKLLLVDEPTSALDVIASRSLLDRLKRMAGEQGCSMPSQIFFLNFQRSTSCRAADLLNMAGQRMSCTGRRIPIRGSCWMLFRI